MTNNQMTQKQRDAFENTLRQALRDANQVLTKKRDEAHDIAIRALVEEAGCTDLVAHISELDEHLSAATAKLDEKGFELHNGTVRLKWNGPQSLSNSYDELVAAHTVSERERVDEIQEALNAAWTVATLPEAKNLVESFATIQ